MRPTHSTAAIPGGQHRRGIGVARIAGVPVVISPSWVLSVAVIAALGVPVVVQVVPGTSTPVAIGVSVVLAVLLGASVLAHELGHCIAARRLGMTVVEVRLYLLGGVSQLSSAPRSPRDEAVIAAAGPAVSAVLAGLCWLAVLPMRTGTVGWLLVMLLALSNLVVALFNVLPALPLDGGRVLRAGVWRVSGNRRAGTTAAVVGGYLIAVLLLGWAVLLVRDGGAGAALPAGIAVVMALFVAVGAAAERTQPGPASWPPGVSLLSLAHPVAQLPAETPVAIALDIASHRVVILTEADGVARGLLDVAAARVLARREPRAPASLVARSLVPEAIVLADDDPQEVADRALTAGTSTFLLVDETGGPAGVLDRADIQATLQRERSSLFARFRRRARPAHQRSQQSRDGQLREKKA